MPDTKISKGSHFKPSLHQDTPGNFVQMYCEDGWQNLSSQPFSRPYLVVRQEFYFIAQICFVTTT
jgi:hypothetical protein